MEAPLISVVIPTYNAAQVIQKCLDGLIRQSSKCFEVIVKDAVSNDGTLELVNAYSEKFSFIRMVSEKDMGIYDAMNKSLAYASGQYIYFLGSDDFLVDEFVMQRLEQAIRKYPTADLIYGDVLSKDLGRKTGGVYGGVFDEIRILRQNICHQAILYKNELFKNEKYHIAYKYYADYAFNLKHILDSKVVKQYVPVLIANFSEGGFSGSTLGDEAFLKDYPSLVSAVAKTSLNSYTSRFKFLFTFFHRVNKLTGPGRSLTICRNEFKKAGFYNYLAFVVAFTRYVLGFYFLKKKSNQ